MKTKQLLLIITFVLSTTTCSWGEINLETKSYLGSDPNVISVTNPKVVPISISFNPELKAGESVILNIGETKAIHAQVKKGSVKKIHARYVIPNPVYITAQRIVNKKVIEQVKKKADTPFNRNVNKGALPKLKDSKKKVRIKNGEFKALFTTEKIGFDDVLVLSDRNFGIEIKGSQLISKNPLIKIEGSLSKNAVVSFR